MKLRVFLPAAERPESATVFHWMLLDARGNVLREDRSELTDAPRAEACEAVLPAARVLFARLKLPRVGTATLRELLPFAVEDRLLADPSHIHAVAAARSDSGDSVVAVVDREWLQAMLDAIRRAGLFASHAWPESALFASMAGTWHVPWNQHGGMIVDDDGAAATFDHDASGKLPLALRLALDEATARDARPSRIVVHPQAAAALPDIARWGAEAGIAFERGAPWEEIARGEPREALELLQGEFSPRRPARVRLPRAALVLAAVIALLQLGFVAIDAARLTHERTRLEGEREALFRDAFPEARVVVDPELQMKRNLAELKRTRGLTVEDDFLAKLSQAAHESGAPARSIAYASGKLTVERGPAPTKEASR
jgi:general secretion pathway protein L